MPLVVLSLRQCPMGLGIRILPPHLFFHIVMVRVLSDAGIMLTGSGLPWWVQLKNSTAISGDCGEICYWKFLYFHMVSIYSKAKFYLKKWISRIIENHFGLCALWLSMPPLGFCQSQNSMETGEDRRGNHFKIGLSCISRSVTFSKTVVCTQTLR